MIVIEQTENEVVIRGHSTEKGEQRTFESTQACASITALSQALLYGIIEELDECPKFKIGHGIFVLDTSELSEQAMLLVKVFMRSVKGVATAYSNYIMIA